MTTVEIFLAFLAALGWVYAVAVTVFLNKALDQHVDAVRIAEATRGDVVFDAVREAFANGQKKCRRRAEKADALLRRLLEEVDLAAAQWEDEHGSRNRSHWHNYADKIRAHLEEQE